MSNYSILQGREADGEILSNVIRLDKLVYPEKYQTILENAIKWHEKNRDIFTFLLDESEVIGYVCVLPVEKGLYNEIRSGRVVQDVTTPLEKVLEYLPGSSYDVYIFSVVLNPGYHGTDAVKYLLKGLFENLQTLVNEGIILGSILADAVSEKGSKLLKSLGFSKVCDSNHDSVIYETKVANMFEKYEQRSH